MEMPPLGAARAMIDTPALLIDLDLMEGNIRLLFDQARQVGIQVRPHLKTVKNPILAQRLLDAGANGVCVAKLGEAEVMAAAGIEDILITTEIIGSVKIARFMELLRKHPRLKVVVDSHAGVDQIAAAAQRLGLVANVLVEINVGQNRCGVQPGRPAVELAQYIATQGSLHFSGVQGYEGHLQHVPNAEERTKLCEQAMHLLTSTVKDLRDAGLAPNIVTTGGTGTWKVCATFQGEGVTEVQPGSFPFMDVDYREAIGGQYANSLSVLATVISRPTATRAVVDAGLKALSNDSGDAAPKDLAGVTYHHGGDEHGILTWNAGSTPELQVGDKIELLPSHCDTTINLFDRYFAFRGDDLEAIWDVSTRGKTQ